MNLQVFEIKKLEGVGVLAEEAEADERQPPSDVRQHLEHRAVTGPFETQSYMGINR